MNQEQKTESKYIIDQGKIDGGNLTEEQTQQFVEFTKQQLPNLFEVE